MDPDLIKYARALYNYLIKEGMPPVNFLARLAKNPITSKGPLVERIAARFGGGAMKPSQISTLARKTGGNPLTEVQRIGSITSKVPDVSKIPLTPFQAAQGPGFEFAAKQLAPAMAKKNRLALATAGARLRPRGAIGAVPGTVPLTNALGF